MNFIAKKIEYTSDSEHQDAPIVVIGMGPVGIRFVQSLLNHNRNCNVVVYGNEPWEPYNRVQLSSFLAGDLGWSDLVNSQKLPVIPNVIQQHHCTIASIDKEARTITDESGRVQAYSKLILATGSRPHYPNIEGIDKSGIYCFRDFSDTQKLLARQVRSRKTVILGGGILGLEAARAMSRQHTDVTVIDHSPRLMSAQLDTEASEVLRGHFLSLGIKVFLGNGVKEFIGEDKVTGIRLRDGREISCDTVILATGIKPNIELARAAKLSVGRGIRVADNMQTSDPDIYAIGECVEHRNRVYGLVKPGYEQAEVAVHSLQGKTTSYTGSISATRLKVSSIPVFSAGRVGEEEDHRTFEEYVFRDHSHSIYRKLVISRGKLVGAIATGEWNELERVQEAVSHQRRIWAWQIKRFKSKGFIWPEDTSKDVSQWPANATICNCSGVTRGQLSAAFTAGHTSVPSLMAATNASTVCGSCRPLLVQFAGAADTPEPAAGAKVLLVTGMLSLLLALVALFLPGAAYNSSVDVAWQWDLLWRDNFIKQLTGYSVLGLSILAMLMSLRKRIKAFSLLKFSSWRLIHVATGLAVILGLAVHGGFHLGNNLNLLLMLPFILLIAVGAIASGVVSIEHCMDGLFARRLRKSMVWLHIVLFWPVPVLLAFHILQTYYF